jgi:multidrug resistance efflux pump
MSPYKSLTLRSPKPNNSELIARLRTDAEELARVVISETEQLTGGKILIGPDPDEYEAPLEAALRRAHDALNQIESEYERATKHSSASTAKARATGETLQLWRASRCLKIAIIVLEAQEGPSLERSRN